MKTKTIKNEFGTFVLKSNIKKTFKENCDGCFFIGAVNRECPQKGFGLLECSLNVPDDSKNWIWVKKELKEEKHYLILAEKSGENIRPVKMNIVISEEPEEFICRNNDEDILMPYFILHWFKAITIESYNKLKKSNPTNEGHFKLLKKDYSKFIKPE